MLEVQAGLIELPKTVREAPTARQPRFAIVVPVFKHPVLVVDALSCALAEARQSNGVIVVVNDGCPYAETHETCLTFAFGYPDLLEYIRTPNGGLSAARNRGIRHALVRFPDIEAIYLLDADNRLSPGAMRRALQRLVETGADWVYPNIDKFGIEWSGDYTAPYSVCRHLFQNICEAGSLVHRRVFDAGISFDEQMRQGYEDWEFWLQCADAGFRGVPLGDFGFQYRARRESMVRNSDRSGLEIIAYIHRKHKKLYSWKNIIRLEHKEAPRFCLIDSAHSSYCFTSIVGESSSAGNLIDLDHHFWRSYAYPGQFHFPNFLAISDDRVIKECARLRIADWILWQIEDLLEQYTFVYVFLSHDHTRVSFTVEAGPGGTDGVSKLPHIVATYWTCIKDCSLDSSIGWIDTLRSAAPEPSICSIKIAAPVSQATLSRHGIDNALPMFFTVLHQVRNSSWRQSLGDAWEWRTDNLIPARELFRQTREHMRALGPLGRCAITNEDEIAFLLPVVSFGGVEQVAIQVATQFRAAGWRTRLIVTEGAEIKAPMRLSDAFDAFCFLNDPPHAAWNPSGYRYYGHDLQKWASEGRIERLIGLVAGSAVVITFQAMQGNEIMGWLRRHGVVTATSLHLVDRDSFGAPEGHPYWMLAYEHAYDIVTAPSQQLLEFCAAAGVPSEKLILMRNAPTFQIDKAVRIRRIRQLELDALAEESSQNRPLRVLSMGRLDRQKGIERVLALIQAAHDNNIPAEWRLVGAAVVSSDNKDQAAAWNADLSITVEAPAFERDAIVDRLLWADVLILLSHWEGAPLIILEAQALGVIPIVTNVGAVSEMINSGVDGIIIPNESLSSIVSSVLSELKVLGQSPARRLVLARSGMERLARNLWPATSQSFLKLVGEMIRHRL